MATVSCCKPGEIVQGMDYNALRDVRVMFVNMPLRETATPNTPPQGPGLMAARLRQYGAEPTIVDLNAYRIKDALAAGKGLPNGRHLTHGEAAQLIQRHIGKHGEPQIIAFSGMITTLRWQEAMAKVCRHLVPDAFIVSGGGLATEIREGLFEWIPELDAVGHSEGDDIMLVLAHELKNRHLDNGSQFHIGSSRGRERFLFGGNRPQNLDALPFAAWDLLEKDVDGNPVLEWYIKTPVWGLAANNSSATPFTMTRSLTTVTSRGCPHACEYCFRGGQGGRNYEMRSAANLFAEAKWLVDTYKIDFLGFPDDNFAIDVRRIKQLPETFAPLGGLRWGTHNRLDEIDSRAFLMAQAGCVYIGVGAESASARTLKSMGKGGFMLRPRGTKEDQLIEINGYRFPVTMVNGIKTARETGIHVNCTWIMAYPEERLEDLKTSVAFILWQKQLMTQGLTPGTPEYAQAEAAVNQRMFVATAYPGTEMCRHPKVSRLLREHFGMSFKDNGDPVVDEALRQYVLELDDATKTMYGTDDQPLNFGEMPDDQFLQAREYVNSGQIEKILDM